MTGSTSTKSPAPTGAGEDVPLVIAESSPHGFESFSVRISWVPPATIFEREDVDDARRLLETWTDSNIKLVAAAAAGDAQRTMAASDARAVVIRQIGNSAVRVIMATGVVATGFVAVALSVHAHVNWALAAPLGTGAVGAASFSLKWIIARRARSTAKPLPPAKQPEEVDQP